ncbi:MAG: glutamine synthetase family protein [Thermoplasmata archaeon]
MENKLSLPKDIDSIALKFLDLRGRVREIRIPPDMFPLVAEDGVSFDSSNVGFTDVSQSDMVVVPDPKAFNLMDYGNEKIAVFLCEMYWPDGSYFKGDPRYMLKNTLKKLADKGISVRIKAEYEFHLLHKDTYEPIDKGRYIDGRTEYSSLISKISRSLAGYDIPVEKIHHEAGGGQYEIEPLPYNDPIKAADDFILIKELIKKIARDNDMIATFMPKPVSNEPGNGLHIHISLVQDGELMFSPGELNDAAKGFIGGLLKHAPGLSAICCPTINSYKRLVPGYEAPVYICWGGENRSVLVRIPSYGNKEEKKGRIEYRAGDASANIYLLMNAMISAGLDGMKRGLDPGQEIDQDLFALRESEIQELDIDTLPTSLQESLHHLEEDDFLMQTLGESAQYYLNEKRKEILDFSREITQWEINSYLEY